MNKRLKRLQIPCGSSCTKTLAACLMILLITGAAYLFKEGEQIMAANTSKIAGKKPLPPIDMQSTGKTETATFAFG